MNAGKMPPVESHVKTLAVVQSNYIPWKGYFDLINFADEFVLLDDVQYTRRDWRNRNRIKTRNGVQWLTIPVQVAGRYEQKIKDTKVANHRWRQTQWTTIRHSYAQAPYFALYKDILEPLYCDGREEYLSEINFKFLTAICSLLGITTRLSWSTDCVYRQGRMERLVDLCRHVDASRYLSGPSAKAYLDEATFTESGITVTYMDYASYPEYDQLFPPFEHHVSILDLLFNVGPAAVLYMKSGTHVVASGDAATSEARPWATLPPA